MNSVDISVLVEITSLSGVRLGEETGSTAVRFDVGAKLEEKERQSGKVVIFYALTVRTKPNVVKYEIEGKVTLSGKDTLISKMLSIDPASKIPLVFNKVYQHAFTAIYTMASLMGTVYPPPDLLFSAKQEGPVEGLDKIEKAGSVAKTQTSEGVKTDEPAAAQVTNTVST